MRRSTPARPGPSFRPATELLEQRDLASVTNITFDFGTLTSPVASGAVRASTETFTAPRGSGWESNARLETRDRVAFTDPLTRDQVCGPVGATYTFRVAVPNGTYNVTPVLGDPAFNHDAMAISLQDVVVASDLSTTTAKPFTATYRAVVTDGLLRVGFRDAGGKDGYFSVLSLNVKSASSGSGSSGSTAIPGLAAWQSNAKESMRREWEQGEGRGR